MGCGVDAQSVSVAGSFERGVAKTPFSASAEQFKDRTFGL